MKDDTVPVLTVDQLLDKATSEFNKRYLADNGEGPDADQIADFRGQILEHAQTMHDLALAEFELSKKAKSPLDLVDTNVVAKAAATRWDAMRDAKKD